MSSITVAPQKSGTSGPFCVYLANSLGGPIVTPIDPALFQPATAPLSIANTLLQLATSAPSNKPSLTVTASASQFDGTAIRALVQPLFDDFLIRIEGQEGKGLIPGATAVVRAIVANTMPATFAESLYFNYGLIRRSGPDPRTYVDLRPGMRLRIETQMSQFVAPAGTKGGTPSSPLSNGFVPGGQAAYDVVELVDAQGSAQIGIDAFLSTATVPIIDPNLGGAGGVVDLQGPNRRGRHLRLCYPRTLPSSDSVGSSDPRQNIALLWADDLKTLAQKTDQYYQSASPGPSALFFRGRTAVVPELWCTLNNAPVFVALGTTIRQLVQRFAPLPRLPGLKPANFTYQRYTPGLPSLTRTQIVFNPAAAFGPDAYDLPVLAGDTCAFGA